MVTDENSKMTLYVVTERLTHSCLLEAAIQEMELPVSRHGSAKAFLESASEPGIALYLTHPYEMPTIMQSLSDRGLFIPVIIVTKSPSVRFTVTSMKRGAVTVLNDPVEHNDLWQGVTDAIGVYNTGHQDYRIRVKARSHLEALTTKDVQLLLLLLDGLTTKTIARRLNITMRTVDTRKKKLIEKTRVSSFADLVKKVVAADLPDFADGLDI